MLSNQIAEKYTEQNAEKYAKQIAEKYAEQIAERYAEFEICNSEFVTNNFVQFSNSTAEIRAEKPAQIVVYI